MQTISEWLADCGSHEIYIPDLIAADFTKCTGQRFPDFVRRHTVKETRRAISARGLGGSVRGDDNDPAIWGWEMAEDFARELVNFDSAKMGRGFIFQDCIAALKRGGF